MFKKLLAILAFSAVTAFATSSDAGGLYGPRSKADTLPAGFFHSYEVPLLEGDPAVIRVTGSHNTDLDCFLIDSAGEIVDADQDMTDVCLLEVTPEKTAPYILVILNLGEFANAYLLQAN